MIFAVVDVLLAVNMCINYSFFTFILSIHAISRRLTAANGGHKPPDITPLGQNLLSVARTDETPRT